MDTCSNPIRCYHYGAGQRVYFHLPGHRYLPATVTDPEGEALDPAWTDNGQPPPVRGLRSPGSSIVRMQAITRSPRTATV